MNIKKIHNILFLLLIATLLVPIYYIFNPPFREYDPKITIRNRVHIETLEYIEENIKGNITDKHPSKNNINQYTKKAHYLSELRNSGKKNISLLRYRNELESDGVWLYYGLLTGACGDIAVPQSSLDNNILVNFLFHDFTDLNSIIKNSKISTPLYILKDNNDDEIVYLNEDKESRTTIPVIWLEEDLWYEILSYKCLLYNSKNNQQELKNIIKTIRDINNSIADSEFGKNNETITHLLNSIEASL